MRAKTFCLGQYVIHVSSGDIWFGALQYVLLKKLWLRLRDECGGGRWCETWVDCQDCLKICIATSGSGKRWRAVFTLSTAHVTDSTSAKDRPDPSLRNVEANNHGRTKAYLYLESCLKGMGGRHDTHISNQQRVHQFIGLSNVDPAEYAGTVGCGG